ncbi:MAG: hypothetical protein AAF989_14945 [Planctomycetota bacterium]
MTLDSVLKHFFSSSISSASNLQTCLHSGQHTLQPVWSSSPSPPADEAEAASATVNNVPIATAKRR